MFYELQLLFCHLQSCEGLGQVSEICHLQKILNKIGQSIDPCGTPETIIFRRFKEPPFLHIVYVGSDTIV